MKKGAEKARMEITRLENAGLENARTDCLWKDDRAQTADTLKYRTLIIAEG